MFIVWCGWVATSFTAAAREDLSKFLLLRLLHYVSQYVTYATWICPEDPLYHKLRPRWKVSITKRQVWGKYMGAGIWGWVEETKTQSFSKEPIVIKVLRTTSFAVRFLSFYSTDWRYYDVTKHSLPNGLRVSNEKGSWTAVPYGGLNSVWNHNNQFEAKKKKEAICIIECHDRDTVAMTTCILRHMTIPLACVVYINITDRRTSLQQHQLRLTQGY